MRTMEDIIDEIRQMPGSVGVVVIGAGCKFKNEVIYDFNHGLADISGYYAKAPNTAGLVEAFEKDRVVITVLDAMESRFPDLRRSLAEMMRKCGAEVVFGVYVKPRKMALLPLTCTSEATRVNKEIAAIAQSHPSAAEFDRFLIVSGREA